MRKLALLIIVIVLSSAGYAQVEKISAKELGEWTFYGIGTTVVDHHDLFLMKESEQDSKGAMVVSPKAYGENVVMKYDVMSLTPASVCVAILSLSDKGESQTITIAENYDGANGKWGAETWQCYFFAFRNQAHNHFPFLRKRSKPEIDEAPRFIDYYDKNVMQNGMFHSIEVGRKNGKIWLKIDRKKILKYKDENPYSGGHLAIRVRGTAGEYASCFIRNLEIIENP